MILPPFLQKGDIVRFVSPAGSIQTQVVDDAEKWLTNWGWQVKRGLSATTQHGRYAGSMLNRLTDLQQALDDPDCKAIFCTRGGYGAIQLIDKLDLTALKTRAKWLIGFSDITLLHSLFQQQGIASIHGGMANMLAKGDEMVENHHLYKILSGETLGLNSKPHHLNRIGEGIGMLRGGNLRILTSLRGTPYDFIPKGSVLFLEDTGEKPYAIERMLYSLKLGGVLEDLSGLIIGQFTDYEEDPLMFRSVYELIADIVSEYKYPVGFNLPVGHGIQNSPLILGATVHLFIHERGVELTYES
jgi:muramoyltetrapeptide carboxypeptidase